MSDKRERGNCDKLDKPPRKAPAPEELWPIRKRRQRWVLNPMRTEAADADRQSWLEGLADKVKQGLGRKGE